MLMNIRLETVSTVDAAVNYIKKQIEDGVFKPGEQIPSERKLQQSLGISRYTLREALAKLSALGIIRIAHGKGAFVSIDMKRSSLGDVFLPLFTNQSPQNIFDFFEARMILEGEAVELAAMRRTDADLTRLKDLIHRSKAAIDDAQRFGELDFLFHVEISRIAGNVFIQKMMECLNDYVKGYLQAIACDAEIRRGSHQTHIKIYECIMKKEPKKVKRLTRDRLSRMVKAIPRDCFPLPLSMDKKR